MLRELKFASAVHAQAFSRPFHGLNFPSLIPSSELLGYCQAVRYCGLKHGAAKPSGFPHGRRQSAKIDART